MNIELFHHAIVSIKTICLGYLFAGLIGFLLIVLSSFKERIKKDIVKIVDFIRPVSAISLFPLFIYLFGLGETTRTIVISWVAWPIIYLNTVIGTDTVDKSPIDAAIIDGAGELLRFWKIKLPMATDSIMTGLRTAMGAAWISLTAAEMIGANEGLGFYILINSQVFDYKSLFLGIMAVACIGFGMNTSLKVLHKIIHRRIYEKSGTCHRALVIRLVGDSAG